MVSHECNRYRMDATVTLGVTVGNAAMHGTDYGITTAVHVAPRL